MENLKIMVEGSGRHVHMSKEDLNALFGEGFELSAKKHLSQPGEFMSESRVDVTGPKGTIKGVGILGPCRKATQVELSFTDTNALGLKLPVRESGDLAGSGSVTLTGPSGSIELKEGAIIAKRHIHLTEETAQKYGIADKEIVQVKIVSERTTIFDDVVARVSAKYADTMHLDYDEINAAAAFGSLTGEVIKKN